MTLTLPPTATSTNGGGLAGLCERARPELAALGELGAPLLAVLTAVEQAGDGRGVDAVADPAFALEVLAAAPGTEPIVVGRVLDFLRTRAGTTPLNPAGNGNSARSSVTVADAVARYEAGALTLLAAGTQGVYRCWARRLAAAHGSDDPGQVTAGDLKDLIAHWAIEARLSPAATRDGGAVEASAVTAYRNLWGYFVDKGWATTNVAKGLRKPPPDDPNRRPFRAEEAALIRHLVRGLRRDMTDEVIVTLQERLGARRIELRRLRLCDVHLDRPEPEMRLYGKGNKYRDMPIPPTLTALLVRYVELCRPTHIDTEVWAISEEAFLRLPPDAAHPEGQRVSVPDRLSRLFGRLHEAAPAVFAAGDLTPHCYRHALASFVDGRWGRAVTKAVLGHKSRRTSTDHYVHVDPAVVREAICAYEAHLLAADPTINNGSETSQVEASEGVNR